LKPHRTIKVVTLGCSKNLVDSEKLMAQLKAANIRVLSDHDPREFDTVIINTCGFIHDAQEESIDTILGYIQQKQEGKLKEVYVAGCLSERFKKPLEKEIPEVDAYFGVNDIFDVLKKVGAEYRTQLTGERVLTTPNHYAYFKIAEGCNRRCSFCAIPSIRGKHISQPVENLLNEAKILAKKGVKELILISQDLTYYGLDLEKRQMLPQLVEALSDLKLFEWIRLHYLYPSTFPEDLLYVMAERDDVCNYLDIPLQHVSDRILKSMQRGVTKKNTIEIVEKFRKQLPGAALRSSFIVGYPGETEAEFNELLDFVRDTEFDRVGVFTYSHENGTSAFKHKDDIPQEIKEERAALLMQLQEEISLKKLSSNVGKQFKVLIDRVEGEFFVGRTEFDSPEVDNEVLISATSNLKIGEFYRIEIESTEAFDMFGKLIVK
jgi:ribosomal protein S12 methylthiotransferase